MGFAESVRTERTRREMSQEALAVAAGLSRKTVQNVESGRPFSSETALALRSVLEIEREAPRPDDDLLDAYLARVPVATEEETASSALRMQTIGCLSFLVGTCLGVFAIAAYSWGFIPWDPTIPSFVVVLSSAVAFTYGATLANRIRTDAEVDLERAAARERFLRDPTERESFRSALSSRSAGERLAGA